MARVKNKRVELWAHLVSEHATCLDLDFTFSDLEDMHEHEHHGPGGIRNHPEASRKYSLKRMGDVLSELEDDDMYSETEFEKLGGHKP